MPFPIQVLRLDHVVFRVGDLERSLRFYGAVLGLQPVLRRDDLGLVHLRAGSSMIDLVAVDGPLGRQGGAAAAATGRNVDHVCLRIESFDEAALRAHFALHQVTVSAWAAGNFGAEGHGPSVYLCDPDGNGIELKGAAHPASAA